MPTGPIDGGRVTNYSRAINLIPNTYGRIQQMGLFSSEGIPTTTVIIDKTQDSLEILPERPRGSTAYQAKNTQEEYLPLIIPHIPHEDYLYPMDLQDRRAAGDVGPSTKEKALAKKMTLLRRRHAQTLEFLRVGALKGLVLGGTGNVILNTYDKFGVTQKVQDFLFSDAATDVPGTMRTVKRYIEENLLAGTIAGNIHCFCGTNFFDTMVNHSKISQAFQFYQAQSGQSDPNRYDLRRGFFYQGIMFEEYNATVTLGQTGNTVKFFGEDEAYFFPVGVPDMFRTYFAPANHMDYVNKDGQELYMFETDPGNGRYVKLEAESNPLPINTRPQAVVKATMS